jgi:multiple sugar transport system substrate-binding protein
MAEERLPDAHSRRVFLRFAFASLGGAAAASLLAACGPASQAPSSGGAAAPTTAAAAPTTAPAAPKPTTAPTAAAASAPTPTAAAASIAAPTPTPYPVANFGSNTAKVSIRYWTILGSVDGIVMNDLVRKFAEANPDIRVESLQGVTDFVTKMEAAAISGTAPDVAIVRHTYVGPFAAKNVLSPLTPDELKQVGINQQDFDQTVWKFTQYQGQQYTVPLDIHLHALLYNKAILSQAGFSKPPATLDEWMDVVTKTSKGDVLGYNTFAIGAGAQEFMTWYWYGIHRQFGGEMLSPDASKAAFNTPEGRAAVKWMHDMQQTGNPRSVPAGDLQRTGKVATWPDGPWISTLYFDKTKAEAADDIDVAPLPQHDANTKPHGRKATSSRCRDRSHPIPRVARRHCASSSGWANTASTGPRLARYPLATRLATRRSAATTFS